MSYNFSMDANELRRMRAIPLEAVLDGFGAQRDPKDRHHNWKVGGSRITVSGDRFFDHDAAIGGGGALDLALHLMGRDFKHPTREAFLDAARWLGAQERLAQTVPSSSMDASPRERTLQAPMPDPTRAGRVRWYLTERRAIPQALVDQAMTRGDLFADAHANAVFRLRDETGREIGFERRGTYGKPFHSVHGDKGLFFAGSTGSTTAAFVESAIEALSYRALHPDRLAVSTTGSAVELPQRMARHLIERGFTVLAAFNADRAGDRLAEQLTARLNTEISRDRPVNAKDWNEVLQASRGQHRPWPAAHRSQDPAPPSRADVTARRTRDVELALMR